MDMVNQAPIEQMNDKELTDFLGCLHINLDNKLSFEDVKHYVSLENAQVKLDTNALAETINKNRRYLDDKISERADIYGVTTGFGNSANNRISPTLSKALQENLIAYHGCGTGEYLSEKDCAATLLIRLNCNARGFSGVSWPLLKQMELF